MYLLETLKKGIETITGMSKPSAKSARNGIRERVAHETMFADDATVPNNPRLPFIHYRNAVALPETGDPAAVFETLFEGNGWGNSWRNGIYDYVHYHSASHEVLGIACGEARVRFGGNRGKIFELHAGDVAVLPAGTGHQCLSASKDLLVVGAYPAGGKYDECTGSNEQHARALQSIPKAPLPTKDPVYGAGGPLIQAWKR